MSYFQNDYSQEQSMYNVFIYVKGSNAQNMNSNYDVIVIVLHKTLCKLFKLQFAVHYINIQDLVQE